MLVFLIVVESIVFQKCKDKIHMLRER